jgi:hypothetical protein
MNHVKTFEQFESIDTESLNEEIKIFGREIKLIPSYSDLLRSKMSFLNKVNLDELKAGVHQREIKDLMLTIDKISKSENSSIAEFIEKANVHQVQYMLDALKELKEDVNTKDKEIGWISFFPNLKTQFAYTSISHRGF